MAREKEFVSRLEVEIAGRTGQERFEVWFHRQVQFDLCDRLLVVRVPSAFYRDCLARQFHEAIGGAAAAVLGAAVRVEYRVDASLATQPAVRVVEVEADAAGSEADGAGHLAGHHGAANGSAVPAGGQLFTEGASADAGRRRPARRWADLNTFVEGPCNRLAFHAVRRVAQQPGHPSPLVLVGPPGVGKSHLLQAVCSAALRGGAAAVYLSGEQFTTAFLEGLRGGGLPSFRRKHRGADVLAIDDLQFFVGKRSTLIELLNTIKSAHAQGRQLVLAADRSLSELVGLGAEILTHLQAGLVCRIDPPAYSTRLGIVRSLCARLGFDLPADVQQYVAAHFQNHARELQGALLRLQATAEAEGRAMSVEAAGEALRELVCQSSRVVRLADIRAAVCEVFGLEPESLRGGHKGPAVNQPRMLAMWLARKHTRAALSEISEFFGRRSHATVLSAQRKVEGWMAGQQMLRLADRTWHVEEAVRRVEERLQAI